MTKCDDAMCTKRCKMYDVQYVTFSECYAYISNNSVSERHTCVDEGAFQDKFYINRWYAGKSCKGEPIQSFFSRQCYADPDSDKYFYFDCYGGNAPALGLNAEHSSIITSNGKHSTANMEWYMYVIGVIATVLVFTIGICGGYLVYTERCCNCANKTKYFQFRKYNTVALDP